ncbi:MAG: type II secretion system protein GspC [Gammaproteobacteria bacterium]|nr:type II secretion system protein GspC [Gammaproteobacteria bacterium]
MSQTFSRLLSQTEQLQPLLKHLPVVINFVLIIACAQLMSELIWMLLDDSSTETMAVTAPVNSVTNNNRSDAKQSQQQAFRNLSSAHLFGIAETKGTVVSADNVPETKLNLVLKGVLAAGTSSIASAIIARGSNGKEEIYGINDKIPGGITLKEIHPEHVILERQGRLETLRMLKSKGSDQTSSSNRTQSTTSAISTASSKKLKNIRNDIIKDPTSFRKYALPVVVRENGKQIGYRLQAQQNSDLLTQAGIKPSDVITSINGIKLDDMKNSIGALNALRSANNVNITVKRNGAEVPLNIQLQ